MPGGYVCSASMKARARQRRRQEGRSRQAAVRKLFSKEQRAFYEAHAPEGIALDDLTMLGPIIVLKLKFKPKNYDQKLVAELWNYPDNSRILELSTKCAPADALKVALEARAFLRDQGVDLAGDQQTKTKTALDYFSKALKGPGQRETNGGDMAENTLSILKPSVNNMTARVFVRAAGLDYEELDVWGKKSTPEFLAKDPADLTPLLEESELPRGSLWESCAIMQYLCNKHGLDQFYPSDPGERAMVDSAMFYLIGTFYPLLARATYPALGFPQYAGETATSEAGDDLKAKAQQEAEAALAGPLEAFHAGSSTAGRSSAETARRSPTSAGPRRSSSSARSTTTSRPGQRTTSRAWSRPRRRVRRAGRGRAGLCRAREVPERVRQTRRGPRSRATSLRLGLRRGSAVPVVVDETRPGQVLGDRLERRGQVAGVRLVEELRSIGCHR